MRNSPSTYSFSSSSRLTERHAFEVGKYQFVIYDVHISHGVDSLFDVSDVAVGKTSDHVYYGVNFPDVAQKFVAQSFAF